MATEQITLDVTYETAAPSGLTDAPGVYVTSVTIAGETYTREQLGHLRGQALKKALAAAVVEAVEGP